MTLQNNFTVYSASAGSGKTFTLVKEYLLLLLKSRRKDAFKNILAITFTNKAVAEMKNRVLEYLFELSSQDPFQDQTRLMRILTEDSKMSSEEIQKKSTEILKSILHNYAAFDISTIDRFTHKIIRTFAKDLGIPVNFDVELNTELILQEAVDRLIDRAGKDELLTEVLLDYTLSKTDDDKSWDISRDLFKFSKLLAQENHLKYITLLKNKSLGDFKKYSNKIKKEIVNTELETKRFSENFFQLLKEEDLDKDCFSGKYLYNYFSKLLNEDYNITWGAKWQTQIGETPLYPKKVDKNKQEILDRRQPEICELFYRTRKLFFKREYLQELQKNITPISLLSEINQEINAIKKERSLVLISDFNPTISSQINNQPAPFIYERLGERYSNYFIDEFQDTSQMQWENLIPLVDNVLSTEFQFREPASLTLVGDAKQSIYRFRGGKAEQFIDIYNYKTFPFQIEQKVENLPKNYRSAPEIVDFNNAFFDFISRQLENPDYKLLFAQGKQEAVKKEKGFVDVSFLECEKKEEEMELHPLKVLEILKNLESKNISKGDICILTRTRKQSYAVANCLSENGVSIVSSESLLVRNSPEVLFINSLLKFGVNPEDKTEKLFLLNYLTNKLQVTDPYPVLLENLEKNDQTFFDWLKEYHIYFSLHLLQTFSIYEAVEYIIREFKLIKTSNAYLQFYLDFVFDFTTSHPGDISVFMDYWDQKMEKLSIIAPKTADAVEVMTIHQSKGLEFPVVIYPFADTKLNDTRHDSLWLEVPEEINEIPVSYFNASLKMTNWGEKEAAAFAQLSQQNEFDNINILYVAFTRAINQLYIISNYDLDKNDQEKKDKVSGLLIGYLKSIGQWNNGFEYSFGECVKKEFENASGLHSINPTRYFSSSTSNQAVQLVTKDGALWGTHQQASLEKGNLVHGILSEIDSEEDIREAIKKYTSNKELDPDFIAEIKDAVIKIVHHKKLQTFFGKDLQIEKERDIISSKGEIFRPDRLNFYKDSVSIIDYKTGEPADTHNLQMENYANILSQMDFKVNHKILVYINEDINILFV